MYEISISIGFKGYQVIVWYTRVLVALVFDVCQLPHRKLGMKRCQIGRCVLFERKAGRVEAVVILGGDDSVNLGASELLKTEEQESSAFLFKPRKAIDSKPTLFNGVELGVLQDGTFPMTPSEKIGCLSMLMTEEGFKSQRALVQYIGVNYRPDISATVQLTAPGNMQIAEAQFKSLHKAIDYMKETIHAGPDFVKLYLSLVRVVVLSDASFANAAGVKSQ